MSSTTFILLALAIALNVQILCGAPLSQAVPGPQCPLPRPNLCTRQPEDTCEDDDECMIGSLCCSHDCPGFKVCKDIPYFITTTKASTTQVPRTTEEPTTTAVPSTTKEPTTTRLPSTTLEVTTTKAPTTTTEPQTTKLTTTEEPTTIEGSGTTDEPTTTVVNGTTERTTTEKRTSTAPTTTQPTTTELPTTTQLPTTTPELTTKQVPATTKIITTKRVPSTTPLPTITPTTQNLFCGNSEPRDILFVVDGTANSRQHWTQRRENFEKIKHFLKKVTSEFKTDKFRVGLMQYGGRRYRERMEINFSDDTNMAQFISRLESMKQIGGSARYTGKALATASNKLYGMNTVYVRHDAQDIIVLITRGPTWDKHRSQSEMQMLREKRVRVITVGVGPTKYLAKHLAALASSPNDLFLAKYRHLANIETEVLKRTCSVSAVQPGVDSLCANKQYDIYFAVDGSASINYKKFQKKQKFLMDLLVLLKKRSDMNIGLMQFSEVGKTKQMFKLEKHSLETEQMFVENMRYQSGKETMLGNAIGRINNMVFNGRGGDRSDVKDTLVIFSDGQAHDLSKALVQAENIKNKGVRVITISVVEYGPIAGELKTMASELKYSLRIRLNYSADYAKKIASLICQSDE